MIEVRIARVKFFTGKKNSANLEYQKIIDALKISISPVQAKAKWQNLISKYKNLKDPPTGVGVEMDDVTAANWEYYDILDKFMSPRHIISPPILISSSETNNGLNIIETDGEIISLEIEPVDIDTSDTAPPKRIRKQPASASDELVKIAKEGNLIMERTVAAFEKYINFQMNQ